MGKYKVPNGASELYRRHLNKTPFAQNPANNRFSLIERMYQRILTELATNRFKWTGLPDEIDVRFLEITLFYFALSVFYKDHRFDKFMALRGGSSGWLNMTDNPQYFNVVGNNFVGGIVSATSETYTDEPKPKLVSGKAIPIWSNYLRMPDLDIVTIYASKLAEIDRTIEINSKNARQTKFISANENQKLSFTNISRQVDEGQQVISVGGMAQDLAFIQALDLGVDKDMLMNLNVLRNSMWSQCMGLLGIDNANQDKKERLVESEVDANSDQTSNMRYVNLNARRMAADAINKEYGLDVKVEYYTDEERRRQLSDVTNNVVDENSGSDEIEDED